MNNVESNSGEGLLRGSALDKVSELSAEVVEYLETETRRAPLKALSIAVVAGFLLRHLPVFGLLGVLIRLLILLVRPAALIFGGVKVCQLLAEVAPPARKAE